MFCNLYEPYKIQSQLYQTTGYKKYETYLNIEEELKTKYGKEADQLTAKRDKLKASANADFKKSMEFLNKAIEKTDNNSVKSDLEKRKVTLNKLLKATKEGFF